MGELSTAGMPYAADKTELAVPQAKVTYNLERKSTSPIRSIIWLSAHQVLQMGLARLVIMQNQEQEQA